MKRTILLLVLPTLLLAAAWISHNTDYLTPPWGWQKLPAAAPPTDQTFLPEYRGFAAAAMEQLLTERERIGTPSLSAAVAHEGEIIWAATAGWSSLQPPVPASVNTVYRIGSTSKALTATAMARLVQSGQLDLDAAISRYVDDLPNTDWQALTPRQLASHTAGLPGYTENRDWWGVYQTIRLGRRFSSTDDMLGVFDDSELLFTPGTGFHYSSFDTNVNAHVMARITGLDYPALMQSLVFAPLQMTTTAVDDVSRRPVTMATFYRLRADGQIRPWRDVDLSVKWPGGGLLSSSSDLARLGSAWLDDDFIKPSVREQFWTPQRLANGEVNEQSYAVGWRFNPSSLAEYQGKPLLHAHHGGVSKGAMSWLVVYPELHLAVAINSNSRAETFQAFAAAEDALTRLLLAFL
ncbi:MAG: serine hydrolase domain-containing protein [Gammaproteobacteria bacterium]|nr:serine hydrolase domain-containing protein [Gammaproteobacteria bacterium]